MQPWLGDRRFLEQGGTLVHAVDTDVIVLYTTPEMSVTLDQREGYAEVFPDDDRFLSEALGRSLARHIFYCLEHGPLLVLPPMEQEIGRVFTGMSSHANSQQVQARQELEKLRGLVQSLDQERDQLALLERLESAAPTLAELLKGARGPSAEMDRLRRLLRDVRIAPLEFALEKGWLSDPKLRHAMEPTERFADRVEFIELRDVWYDRLLESKSASRRRVIIYDDSAVLARLEWINRRFDQARYRLVLITGDSSIHRAARTYKPNGQDHYFGDLYLRHPRAYLAEPGVLSPESLQTPGSAESELLGWLDTFLGEGHTRGTSYREELDELLGMGDRSLQDLAAPVLESHPGIVKEFRDRWASYTKNLFLTHGLEGPANEPTDVLSDLRHGIDTILQRVDDLLRRRVVETWQACFEMTVSGRFGPIR